MRQVWQNLQVYGMVCLYHLISISIYQTLMLVMGLFILHVRDHEKNQSRRVDGSKHIISKGCITSQKFLQKDLGWLSKFDGEL